ncbi:TPA: hypothetical protein N0F65_007409 [Lagenidium giganteum]|uniref:Uncharacterized protein n=1 Tax=Lagenidium giganteum TaxID=4803 RepID=A0AAV2YS12_9STRA|nr:TPA: hypothetical protein N0F65_009538 [Lagenidium giganteum]DBA05247.1 TPA: hypothetical protein N0F65_007409 [Lagenidium giganteum]
MARLTSRL